MDEGTSTVRGIELIYTNIVSIPGVIMGNTNHTNNTGNIGKPISHTQQGQAHERGAVRHRLTDAQLELSIAKRVRKIVERNPELRSLL